MPDTRHAASRSAIRTASGTRPRPASGRPCGWNRSRKPLSMHSASRRTSMTHRSRSPCRRTTMGGKPAVKVEVLDGQQVVQQSEASRAATSLKSDPPQIAPTLTLKIPNAKRWSPDTPFLYGLRITLLEDGQPTDQIDSYFGLRKIALGKDEKGILRLMLNNQAAVPVRPARPGLLARRAVHGADRRGPAVRHRDDPQARLQHGPQARQGRAGPLVLLVRQAGPAGLAGHAQRQLRRQGRPAAVRRGQRRSTTRTETPRRRSLQPPVASSCGCRSTKAGASTRRAATST